MKKSFLFIILLFFAFSGRTQIHPTYQGLFNYTVDSICKKLNIKGVSVAICIPGSGIWTGSYGESYANMPITSDMYLPIGSNTKTFVAAIILKLQEEGKLNIDDTIGKWLQNIPNVNGQITIKQMLNHTSGLFSYTDNPAFFTNLNANYNKIWQPEDMLQFIDTPNFVPGASWEYSNTNFLLAGIIVSKILNEPFDVTVRKMILTPLNLTHTITYPAENPNGIIPHGWSVLASQSGTLEDMMVTYGYSNVAFLSMASSAGAIVSTAEDNVKFWDALMSGKIINSASLAMMKDFVFVDPNYQYGLGLSRMTPVNGRSVLGHGGTCFGYINENLFDSINGVCITALSNQDSIGNNMLFNKLVMALHKITINMPPADVNHIKTNAGIQIYPNPANNLLNVHMENADPTAALNIYDMAGHLVQHSKLEKGTNTILLTYMPAGLYLIKINDLSGTIHTKKVQVNNN